MLALKLPSTTRNSSGVSNRARIGTVTNLSPNVPVFDDTLQPTFVVIVLRLGAWGIRAFYIGGQWGLAGG